MVLEVGAGSGSRNRSALCRGNNSSKDGGEQRSFIPNLQF